MMKKSTLLILIVFIVVISSCSSTKINSSWREPDKTVVVKKLNKVLVVALFKNEISRHKAEDQMAGNLDGKGIVSHNYLNADFNKANEASLREKIKADVFDAAVIIRLVDVDKAKICNAGDISNYPTYYRHFSGYYYRGWPNYSTPGFYSTTKIYTIETNVYFIKQHKIISLGLTKTTSQDGVKKMTEAVTKTVYKKCLKKGLPPKDKVISNLFS